MRRASEIELELGKETSVHQKCNMGGENHARSRLSSSRPFSSGGLLSQLPNWFMRSQYGLASYQLLSELIAHKDIKNMHGTIYED